MGSSTRGCDPTTWRGREAENKIVNQLIITTTVPPTYFQVFNTTISTVDGFEEGILNSGVSGHYGKRKSDPYCSEVLYPLTPNPIQVTNGEDMQAAKRVKFQLSDKLSDKSQQGYTYYNLKTGTLFSVRQLTDDDCVSIFSERHSNVFKNINFIIKGRRNPINVLYNTPFAHTDEPSIPSSNQNKTSD